MVPIALSDTITLQRTGRVGHIQLSSNRPDLPRGRENLAYQAAELFFRATGVAEGCRIFIRKRIPLGAGLGGGSANAATVLLGLNRLYGQPLSKKRLVGLARSLGSDVPFFLKGCACVARGRGERLRPIRLPKLNLLLHFPGYPIATTWAYRQLDLSRSRLTSFRLSPKILGLSLRQRELARVVAQVQNSFEPVVFARHPDLAMVKRRFLESGAYAAALSGSGSTVYGLVEQDRGQDPMAAMRRHGIHCVRTCSVGRVRQVRIDNPVMRRALGRRPNGRTQDFGSWYEGSNPPAPVHQTRPDKAG